MNRLLIFFLFVTSIAAAANAAGFEAPNYDRVSESLFPETRDWQAVDSLPSPDAAAMLRDRWLFRLIYLKTEQSILMEEPECSFITRALYEHLDAKLFKVADLDGDGFDDIVYSGSLECGEGYAAVIWFGAESGLARRPVEIIPYLLLRVEMGGRRRMSGVEPACCAGSVDEYFVGDLENPKRVAREKLHNAP
jgi:hypothetical protein